MAILKTADIQPTEEEQRHQVTAGAFLTTAPTIPGFNCIRHFTPLVVTALHNANNPYMTGTKGFEALGIDISKLPTKEDGEDQKAKQALSDFALKMMPKTAEVLVLLCCTREELKQFALNPVMLESNALDLMENSSLDALAGATVHIAAQQGMISKSQATKAEGEEKPDAISDKKNGAKKKHVVSGLPNT